MQLHTKGVRSMSHASGSMSSTGKALKMTISMNAGFRFAKETVSPTFPVIERIKKKFQVNDYRAQKYYDHCMHKFAMYPNIYRNMNGEELMERCFEFISTLQTGNSDDEDLPAPGRRHVLHQDQSPPLSEMYERYHVRIRK
jgi:hypothetical protein